MNGQCAQREPIRAVAEHAERLPLGLDGRAFKVGGGCAILGASELMKGFIGTANIDTNSRLCMASPVAAPIRAFGEDVVPSSYDDTEFSDAERDRAQRFWASPTICAAPGLKAVDMCEAMAKGRIKAVSIMATNPAVSVPDARITRIALANCPFVVVSDCMAKTDIVPPGHRGAARPSDTGTGADWLRCYSVSRP